MSFCNLRVEPVKNLIMIQRDNCKITHKDLLERVLGSVISAVPYAQLPVTISSCKDFK